MITRFGSLRLPGLALSLWPVALFARTLPEIGMSRDANVSMRAGASEGHRSSRRTKRPTPRDLYAARLRRGNREGWAHGENDEYHSSALELSIVKP
jgi:hypothetical protein